MESNSVNTVKRARSGDESALSELLEQYRPMLARAVSLSYPGLQSAGYTVEDLMQEASIALADAVRGYDPDKGFTFGAYARRCVRNRLVSVARRAAKKEKRPAPLPSKETDAPVFDRDFALALEQRLTVYERSVFRMIVDGYKPAEIAGALGREVKSVYNAVCRIKAKAAGYKNKS